MRHSYSHHVSRPSSCTVSSLFSLFRCWIEVRVCERESYFYVICHHRDETATTNTFKKVRFSIVDLTKREEKRSVYVTAQKNDAVCGVQNWLNEI